MERWLWLTRKHQNWPTNLVVQDFTGCFIQQSSWLGSKFESIFFIDFPEMEVYIFSSQTMRKKLNKNTDIHSNSCNSVEWNVVNSSVTDVRLGCVCACGTQLGMFL